MAYVSANSTVSSVSAGRLWVRAAALSPSQVAPCQWRRTKHAKAKPPATQRRGVPRLMAVLQGEERAWATEEDGVSLSVEEEVHRLREERLSSELDGERLQEVDLQPVPEVWRGVADDASIHNPLERLNRLGCGWMGAVFEWEGVLVGDFPKEHRDAWLTLAEEEGKPPPLAFALKRADGMKSEQVIGEVFCWTRNPMEVRRLATRKLQIFRDNVARSVEESGGGSEGEKGEKEKGSVVQYSVAPGVRPFLENLQKNDVPCAVGCSAAAVLVEEALDALDLSHFFQAVITADDVERGRPDPEAYMYAAQRVGRVPARCVVIGNSNAAIEAAHDAGMRCVAVLSATKPAYELASADLVVRQLDELSLVNLKQLFSQEDTENPNLFGSPQMEEELEVYSPMTSISDWDDQ